MRHCFLFIFVSEKKSIGKIKRVQSRKNLFKIMIYMDVCISKHDKFNSVIEFNDRFERVIAI